MERNIKKRMLAKLNGRNKSCQRFKKKAFKAEYQIYLFPPSPKKAGEGKQAGLRCLLKKKLLPEKAVPIKNLIKRSSGNNQNSNSLHLQLPSQEFKTMLRKTVQVTAKKLLLAEPRSSNHTFPQLPNKQPTKKPMNKRSKKLDKANTE